MAGRRGEEDERNKMIDAYIEFIKLVKPKILFFENVKGFTIGFKKENSQGEAYSNYVTRKLKNLGYDVKGKIIDFSEFGIPQRRKRFILVGFRQNLNKNPEIFFDELINNRIDFLKRKNLGHNKISVKEAISDLEGKNGKLESIEFGRFNLSFFKILEPVFLKFSLKFNICFNPSTKVATSTDLSFNTRFPEDVIA